MRDELDLDRLAQIPDPFAETVGPAPPMTAPAGTAAPTRAEVGRRRLIAAAAAVLYEIAWVAVVERRHDLASLPASTLGLGLLVPLGAAVVAFGAVSGKGRLGLGAPVLRLAFLAALAPVLFAVATVATSPRDDDGPFWGLAGRCMAVTAVLMVPPLVLAVLAFRRAFVTASVWRTGALGVACGGLAAATMSLVCWHSGALHVVVGHGAMMVAGGALGALLGRSITRA